MSSKILKKSNANLIFAIASFVIMIILFVVYDKLSVKYDKNNLKAYNYDKLILDNADKPDMLVDFNFNSLPYLFASNDSEKFYIVFNNNYAYMVSLSDETYEKIENQYNKEKDNFNYNLRGYLKSTNDSLKKLAIEALNSGADEKKITLENYSSYLGSSYLDEDYDYYGYFSLIFLASVAFFVAGVVFLIKHFKASKKYKKVISKYGFKTLNDEISDKDTKAFLNDNLYLTNKYAILNSGYLVVIPYEEIIWNYTQEFKYKGITTAKYVVLCDKKRAYQVRHKLNLDKSKLNEIAEIIYAKNNKVLVGYSSENLQKYREIKKSK